MLIRDSMLRRLLTLSRLQHQQPRRRGVRTAIRQKQDNQEKASAGQKLQDAQRDDGDTEREAASIPQIVERKKSRNANQSNFNAAAEAAAAATAASASPHHLQRLKSRGMSRGGKEVDDKSEVQVMTISEQKHEMDPVMRDNLIALR